MLIKEMFTKDISRDIKGVVKVGQDSEELRKQELEEYVVTRELQRHFRDFFAAYKKGIDSPTDNMGVWIAGFFGSGKSHFLKILSYLLENSTVDSKKALDYFLDDEKIKDPMVIANMKSAAAVPTDVILFNIDSKSDTSGIKDKDSILNVFLKVFNEKLGYSPNPHVADLERYLDSENKYEKFQEKYFEITNRKWLESRHQFGFMKGKVVETLIAMDFMDAQTAEDWSRGTVPAYELSIERFTMMVNDYLNTKADDHHLIFLVDEIGQYIGNDTDLMLNLQTITEELGTKSRGKAWVIVTSQQDIDSITQVKGNDFSKIQGRFNTRISLTSANVDEVIKLRILEKTDVAKDTLKIVYENNQTLIKNLLIFTDSVEKKLYENKETFANVYPFVPYQFDILAKVLTSIRKHGASGKHLSEGERSMLALFKESAETIMDKHEGAIVPFSTFYDALNKFLDHSHSVVISKALDSGIINPNKEEDCFNVNVLKTLFMIKYVDEVESNIENITTLMVSNINDDRRLLREKVEEALKVLTSQMLIQKNGDRYIFLTDEEQEINREIESQVIENSELIRKLSEIIYADIFFEERIQVDGYNNRYAFSFNRLVDQVPYKSSQAAEIGVSIITPNSEHNGNDTTLRMLSSDGKYVFVDLPNDDEFLNELRLTMKIEKYLNSSTARNTSNFEEIRHMKRLEMREHLDRSKLFLNETLKDAKYYISGSPVSLASRDFKSNLRESLTRVIQTVYHKLNRITETMSESDIHSLFIKQESKQITIEEEYEPNVHAINELLKFIELKTKSHTKISLREIQNQFRQAPYGFIDIDISWLVAKAFRDGQISLSLNGKLLSVLGETRDNLVDYLTKSRFSDKLLVDIKIAPPIGDIRILKEVYQELFKEQTTTMELEYLAREFYDKTKLLNNQLENRLEYYKAKKYPGEKVIRDGLSLLRKTEISNSNELLSYIVDHKDDFYDFVEDYAQVEAFFKGSQKELWDKGLDNISIYDDSNIFLVNKDLKDVVKQIKSIMEMENPYRNIKDLPSLNSSFDSIYGEILKKEQSSVIKNVEEDRGFIKKLLASGKFEVDTIHNFTNPFDVLIDKVSTMRNILLLKTVTKQSETLRDRFHEDIIKLKKGDTGTGDGNGGQGPTVKTEKIINVKDVISSSSWRLETNADLDNLLDNLRKKIEESMEEDTIIHVRF